MAKKPILEKLAQRRKQLKARADNNKGKAVVHLPREEEPDNSAREPNEAAKK